MPSSQASAHKFPGLAVTPPMGWNSWNAFHCDIHETLMREVADALVTTGMRDAGYEYLNLDDCWQGERDGRGVLRPDLERFPSGMKALGDYIHARGLKFGIYSDAGWKSCAGRPGSRGHEAQDARTFASWGVDFLKYDWCFSEGLDAREAYRTMGRALAGAGRPVIFSICEWAMLAAPLIAGNDVRKMSQETLGILTNREVIAVDQDWLGVPGFRYGDHDGVEVWFRPLAVDDWAFALLNRTPSPRSFTFDWRAEGVSDELSQRAARFDAVEYRIRDLWAGVNIGTTADPLSAVVPGRDVVALRLSPL